MITFYDYGIILFYLLFMVAIGLVFRRMSSNTSDYFRAGGAMPWWITGTSAWIASFTAWTFTGAAGKVYETGTLVLVVFWATVVGLGLVYFSTCLRFRRMRVVTWMEAVRHRYGSGAEQFYTWIKLPLVIFFAGLSLNAIGVFMASVFRVDITLVLILLGIVVTVVAVAGGAWAVLASDFVQMFLVMTITLATAVLVLVRPDIGGLTGLLEKVPSAHFNWTELARFPIILAWIGTMIWFKFSDMNNMENSSMYLMAGSDRDARRMVLIPIIGSFVGPLIWFVPSMAATVLHPNLAAEYPLLKQPHEAAFVSVAIDVMPQGLLGLLICAMLGATVTSMDAGLNKGVGIFVRSLYRPLFQPYASERHLLLVGKICTVTFGLLIMLVAVAVNRYRTIGLFDLANQFAANFLMPLALPLIFGLFVRRTPGWSSWSTALVGGVASYVLGSFVDPHSLEALFNVSQPFNAREVTDLQLALTSAGTVIVGSSWYFGTAFFYRYSSQEEQARIASFFRNLDTPTEETDSATTQIAVYRLLGRLCQVYGAFITLLVLIPNSLSGRAAFVFCGGSILISGFVLVWIGQKKRLAQDGQTA